MRFIRYFCLLLFCQAFLCLLAAGEAVGQIQSASVGFKGNCKLGYWVPVLIRFKGELPQNVRIETTLPDTEGVATTFVDDQPRIRDLGSSKIIESAVKLGRSKGMAKIVIHNAAANETDPAVIAEKQFRISELCTPVDSLVEFYVSLGRPIELKGAVAIGAQNHYAPAMSVSIESKDLIEDGAFASHWKSLESVDGIIVEAGSFVETPMPFATQTALAEWVIQGGRLAITGGAKLKEFLEKNSELGVLFKAELLGTRRLSSTSAIERTVKAADPVSGQRNRPFVAIMRNVEGEVLIQEGTDPVFISQAIGFGHLFVLTVNLADKPISEWSDLKSLGGYLLSQLSFKSDVRRTQEKRATRFGYQDLSGQLRSALDDFSAVVSVNFTVVAAIAILFIALIGPVDYFLLKRFAKRMEWTWVTFSMIVVAICFLTYLIHRSAKSDKLICRQVEIVDVDVAENRIRGSLWCHVYSPASRKYEISWSSAPVVSNPNSFGSWFGFPSDALGGMDNNSVNTGHSQGYFVNVPDSKLTDLPINVASTRGLQVDWEGQARIGKVNQPTIVRNRLSGRMTNPLDKELENVFVVHNRSVYQLKGRLGPGDSFVIEEDCKERNFGDYLNLRRVKDLGTEATPWSITDTNLQRILEIMMFYERAGGHGYVSLFQRYLRHADFSHIVGDDRAILVGRTEAPASRLVVDGKKLDEEYEESWTYYRVLIPVKTKSDGDSQ